MLDDSSLLSNPGVNALLWGGYPGQDGGTAIVNILTGKTAPAGRLPVTQYPVSPAVCCCEVNLLISIGGLCRRDSYDKHESSSVRVKQLQPQQPRVCLT